METEFSCKFFLISGFCLQNLVLIILIIWFADK
nr:MAG TPA: hypothetical protein [Caudoviricetes sp.]